MGGESKGVTRVYTTCIDMKKWAENNEVMGGREGGENKEHGMIYNEQYKHGGSMEDRENSFNHQYKYSSKIELTQEV